MKTGWRKTFFPVWSGQAFSLFGSSLVDFALIWWLTETTGSETILALSTLASLLPIMFLGPFAGSLIDRFSRQRVMILADGAIALVTLLLLLCFQAGVVQVWMIFIVLVLRSLGSAFHRPAMMASTAMLVPADYLTRVGGMNRVLTGAMNIVCPVLGALLIGLFDIRAVLLIDVITAAIAVMTLAFVSIPNPPQEETRQLSVWRQTVEGAQYLKSAKNLCFVVFTCTATNVFCGAWNAFQSLIVVDAFGGGATELGYLGSANGIGLLIGGCIMGAWGGFQRKLITSGFGWLGYGLSLVAFVLTPRHLFFPVALGAILVSGIFMAIGCSSLDAFYQTYVPLDKQGRVFSLLTSLDNLTVPVGLIIAAVVGSRLPVRIWPLLVGLFHITLGICWYFSKNLKAAEEVVPPENASL